MQRCHIARFCDNLLRIFTALHEMQMQSSDENSLSIRRVNCDKTEEKSVQVFISY